MSMKKEKIEEVLQKGKTILLQRPELNDTPLHQILDVLSDGTQDMIQNRWGVLAHVIIGSISDWQVPSLVTFLSKIELPDLAYEYVGYILQKEHEIDLEELLIVANDFGSYDRIIKYVSPNLRFKTKILPQHIVSFLNVLEMHKNEGSLYYTALAHYAEGINSCDDFLLVLNQVIPINSETKYFLIYNLRSHWYSKNIDEASAQIEILLRQSSIWSWKVAIDFCEYSLNFDTLAFMKYFHKIEDVISNYDELKLHAISLWVGYICKKAHENDEQPTVSEIVSKLKSTLTQIPSAKYKFIQKIEYIRKYPKDIHDIFNQVLSTPDENKNDYLKHLDTCFYFMLESEDYQIVLDDMFAFFSANKYRKDYSTFFDSLNSTSGRLRKHADKIADIAIKYISKPNLDYMFFGLGLLVNFADINSLHKICIDSNPDYLGTYDEEQLIRTAKAVLLFSVLDEKICEIAFSLMLLVKGEYNNYINFCVHEVYYDYPFKMHEISIHYKKSGTPSQIELAEQILKLHLERENIQKKSLSIPDISPSQEHLMIYQRAQLEQSREITRRANELSILASLVCQRTLKYGKRNGYVTKDGNNQQSYTSGGFQKLKYEHHFPVTYVTDPVEFSSRRAEFLQEVEENAPYN